MHTDSNRLVSFSDLKAFCCQAYMKVGVPADEAEIIADLLARSDLRGVETHGVTRLPIYILRLQKGYVRKECQLTPVKDKGPTAFLEAHGSMGHIVAYRAMEKAIAKAREYGIGWVSVKDSGHFGVAGLFPMMALDKDYIGYIVSNSAPMMFPWGGTRANNREQSYGLCYSSGQMSSCGLGFFAGGGILRKTHPCPQEGGENSSGLGC